MKSNQTVEELKIKMEGFVCLWARKKEVEELYIPLGTLKKNFPFVQWKFSQPTMLHNIKGTCHREPVWGSSTAFFLEQRNKKLSAKIWINVLIFQSMGQQN